MNGVETLPCLWKNSVLNELTIETTVVFATVVLFYLPGLRTGHIKNHPVISNKVVFLCYLLINF